MVQSGGFTPPNFNMDTWIPKMAVFFAKQYYHLSRSSLTFLSRLKHLGLSLDIALQQGLCVILSQQKHQTRSESQERLHFLQEKKCTRK